VRVCREALTPQSSADILSRDCLELLQRALNTGYRRCAAQSQRKPAGGGLAESLLSKQPTWMDVKGSVDCDGLTCVTGRRRTQDSVDSQLILHFSIHRTSYSSNHHRIDDGHESVAEGHRKHSSTGSVHHSTLARFAQEAQLQRRLP
jgi:hypothetical protein